MRINSLNGPKAPLTEEITFRIGVITVMRLAAHHLVQSSLAVPFGSAWVSVRVVVELVEILPVRDTAHLHHAWETYNQYGRTGAALKRAAAMCRE